MMSLQDPLPQPVSRFLRNHWGLAVPMDNDQTGWYWLSSTWAGLSYGMWRCLAPLPTRTWKLHLARQALQPSWRHLTRWSSMLDCHHTVNSSRLRWSPTAQSTGMLFSSWASSAAGDWWKPPETLEHLRFYSNGFPSWCNVLIRFCCTIGCTALEFV